MKLTPRFEALRIICLAGSYISGILLFNGSTPEIRVSGFVSFVSFIVIMTSMVIISFVDENRLKNRTLPIWNNIGLFMMFAGFLLFTNPVLGVSITLTGMTISLYAIHYRERKTCNIVESDSD